MKSKITTLICVTILLLGLFALAINSINSVKPAKIDKKTAFLSSLIDSSANISKIGDKLYNLLNNFSNLDSHKIIKIENDDGTVEDISEYDVFYRETKNLSTEAAKIERTLDKLNDNEYSDNYTDTLQYLNKALEIVTTSSEDIVDSYEYDNSKENLTLKTDEIKKAMGSDALMVKYYSKKALETFHK